MKYILQLKYFLRRFFSKKKALLTGPISSGKTTFLQYISKEKIPDGASGSPRSYKVKDAVFDEVTDCSGADAWKKEVFDKDIKKHDYILFFFDVSEYLKDDKYRIYAMAIVDSIYKNKNSSHKTLMVGTHIDKVNDNYKVKVEESFAGKKYQDLLTKIVYVNTTKKECVETILNELK